MNALADSYGTRRPLAKVLVELVGMCDSRE